MVLDGHIERSLRALVEARYPKSICPSDVARALSPDDFRPLMPKVREVAARLAARGQLVVTQRGTVVDAKAARGPIRITLVRASVYPRSMPVYVALLRAINVGGTGKLAMAELCALCEAAGFTQVKTYIQSGNVVFGSKLTEGKAHAKLSEALAKKIGKPVGVALRSRAELEAVIAANPFPEAPANRLIVSFLAKPPPKDALSRVVIPGDEEVAIVGREVFIHYGEGMAHSKLKLPFAKEGTGRNLNTVKKLAAMAEAAERA